MADVEIEHNLEPEELSKALVGLAIGNHLEQEVAEALHKAMEEAPKVPANPAMRGLFFRFRDLYAEASRWIRDYAETVASGKLEKAQGYLDRPLSAEEIQRIQQAIRDRFGFIAAQMESVDPHLSDDLLERWRALGLVEPDVTAKNFALSVPAEKKLIRNAFVFGRLHQALDQGKSYDEILKLALNDPLLKPDLHAIAVAEQQTANYITSFAEDMATEAGQLIAARNRELVRKMAVDFHARKLQAKVNDEAAKRLLGMEIPEQTVDTWQGFSSELYHAMENKAADWDRIAFYELNDAKGQGRGFELLEKYGPGQLVYKMPLPTACAQCRRLYLNEDGRTPRLFRLAEMLSWGNNIGRKPMPVRGGDVSSVSREDGAETLKAVAGQVHPWCECQGPFILTKMEHWYKDNPHGAGA